MRTIRKKILTFIFFCVISLSMATSVMANGEVPAETSAATVAANTYSFSFNIEKNEPKQIVLKFSGSTPLVSLISPNNTEYTLLTSDSNDDIKYSTTVGSGTIKINVESITPGDWTVSSDAKLQFKVTDASTETTAAEESEEGASESSSAAETESESGAESNSYTIRTLDNGNYDDGILQVTCADGWKEFTGDDFLAPLGIDQMKTIVFQEATDSNVATQETVAETQETASVDTAAAETTIAAPAENNTTRYISFRGFDGEYENSEFELLAGIFSQLGTPTTEELEIDDTSYEVTWITIDNPTPMKLAVTHYNLDDSHFAGIIYCTYDVAESNSLPLDAQYMLRSVALSEDIAPETETTTEETTTEEAESEEETTIESEPESEGDGNSSIIIIVIVVVVVAIAAGVGIFFIVRNLLKTIKNNPAGKNKTSKASSKYDDDDDDEDDDDDDDDKEEETSRGKPQKKPVKTDEDDYYLHRLSENNDEPESEPASETKEKKNPAETKVKESRQNKKASAKETKAAKAKLKASKKNGKASKEDIELAKKAAEEARMQAEMDEFEKIRAEAHAIVDSMEEREENIIKQEQAEVEKPKEEIHYITQEDIDNDVTIEEVTEEIDEYDVNTETENKTLKTRKNFFVDNRFD